MNQMSAAARLRRVLTVPPVLPAAGPRLKTNLDTDLLKLAAIAVCSWIFYS